MMAGLTRLIAYCAEHGANVEQLYLKGNLVCQLEEQLHRALPALTHLYLHR